MPRDIDAELRENAQKLTNEERNEIEARVKKRALEVRNRYSELLVEFGSAVQAALNAAGPEGMKEILDDRNLLGNVNTWQPSFLVSLTKAGVERQPPCPRATTILSGFEAAEVGVSFGVLG